LIGEEKHMPAYTREHQRHRTFALLLLVALMTTNGLAQAETRSGLSGSRLSALDTNADGLVSLAELAGGPVDRDAGMRLFLARHYKAIDRNRDGHISEAELEVWRERYEVSESALARSLNDDPRSIGTGRDFALRP
jgi:hypothetical protein